MGTSTSPSSTSCRPTATGVISSSGASDTRDFNAHVRVLQWGGGCDDGDEVMMMVMVVVLIVMNTMMSTMVTIDHSLPSDCETNVHKNCIEQMKEPCSGGTLKKRKDKKSSPSVFDKIISRKISANNPLFGQFVNKL